MESLGNVAILASCKYNVSILLKFNSSKLYSLPILLITFLATTQADRLSLIKEIGNTALVISYCIIFNSSKNGRDCKKDKSPLYKDIVNLFKLVNLDIYFKSLLVPIIFNSSILFRTKVGELDSCFFLHILIFHNV